MTFDRINIEFSRLSVKYGAPAYEKLTRLINQSSSINNVELEEIGRAVGRNVRHFVGPLKDGYRWFGALVSKIRDVDVAVLFPWRDPKSRRLERPVGVYSEGDSEGEEQPPPEYILRFIREIELAYYSLIRSRTIS